MTRSNSKKGFKHGEQLLDVCPVSSGVIILNRTLFNTAALPGSAGLFVDEHY